MALSQLLYTSDATGSIGLDELLEIQDVAIRNNAQRNITGMLFFTQGRFVQFLEGERTAVQQLFQTILQDERHHNGKLLYDRPADERVFAKWHMAMLNLDLHSRHARLDLQDMVHLAEHQTGSCDGAEPPGDLVILSGFRDLLDA